MDKSYTNFISIRFYYSVNYFLLEKLYFQIILLDIDYPWVNDDFENSEQ